MLENSQKFDGGELAIMAARIDAVARRMSSVLLRTGRSGVLNRAKDLSCCIVSADHELVCTADSLPIHVLSGPDLMARSLFELHDDIRPGDAFLNNSPYHGCSHPADHTILLPVFDPNGRHAFTVLVKAHQADIGNSIPTTYFVAARDIYEEGALIFPNVRVARADGADQDFIRMCEMRIRAPEQWKGDFLAMLGAARCGERDLIQLGADHGWDRLRAFSTQWIDYSERMMRSAIANLPEAAAWGESIHDPMPGTPADGVRMSAQVELRPREGKITVDICGNPDVLGNGLNLSEACARTSVLIGVFNSLADNIPKNAGAFRPIEIKLRPGSCAGGARHPASCSASTTNLADRLTAAVQLAFATIGNGLGMAEIGPINPPSKGVLSGTDPRTGKFVVTQLFLGSTGGAASNLSDGWLTHSHAGNAGMSLVESVELAELYLPIIVRERLLLKDTEGAGEHIGAPALQTLLECDADNLNIVYASDGTFSAAQGAQLGHSGWLASAKLIRVGSDPENLPNVGNLSLMRGDRIVSIGAGGGGYGDPGSRPIGKLLADIENGMLSPERVKTVYRRTALNYEGLDTEGSVRPNQSFVEKETNVQEALLGTNCMRRDGVNRSVT